MRKVMYTTAIAAAMFLTACSSGAPKTEENVDAETKKAEVVVEEKTEAVEAKVIDSTTSKSDTTVVKEEIKEEVKEEVKATK